MQEVEVEFLKDMAKWMEVVGEGIHVTRPWLNYGELEKGKSLDFVSKDDSKGNVYKDPEKVPMGRYKLNDGDIRFTRSKDSKTIYATRLTWPEESFTLTSFGADAVGKDIEISSIELLGSDAPVKWKRTTEGIVITPPKHPVFEDATWPVMFKLVL